MESGQGSRHGRHLKKCYTSHIHRPFAHEKPVCKIGATLVHNGTKISVVSMFQSSVWRTTDETWVHHFTLRRSNKNNGLKGENRLQRREQAREHLQARLCRQSKRKNNQQCLMRTYCSV